MSNGASIHQFPPERSAKIIRKIEKRRKAEQRQQKREQQKKQPEDAADGLSMNRPKAIPAGLNVTPFPVEPHQTPAPEASHESTTKSSARSTAENARKHWRVDLKWLFGIPCTIVLALTLAVLAMFVATDRGRAEQTVAAANRIVLAQEFQGDARLHAPQLYAFLDSPDFAQTVYDNPDTLTAQVNAVPNDASMPQAGDGGISAGSAGASGQAGQAQGIKTMFGLYGVPLSILNADVHQALGGVLIVLLLVLAALAVPFVIFSHRIGKLVSIGVSLAVASWAPFLFLKLASSRANGWAAGSGVTDDGEMALRQIMQPLFDGMFSPAMSVYRVGVFLSLALLAGTALGKLAIQLNENR